MPHIYLNITHNHREIIRKQLNKYFVLINQRYVIKFSYFLNEKYRRQNMAGAFLDEQK